LKIAYWKRYEAENYFITPDLLRRYAGLQFPADDLFAQQTQAVINAVLDALVLEQVFDGVQDDFAAWRQASPAVARVLWEAKTERRKLSAFAEAFFRRLAERTSSSLLLRKGELHRLVALVPPEAIAPEVREKLDLLDDVFAHQQDGTREDRHTFSKTHGNS